MKRVFCLFRNFCRGETLFSGVLLAVLLAFVPGLVQMRSLWLTCAVRYLLPAALAVCIAFVCYDVPAAALGVHGLMRSILLSAPVAILCVVNIIAGEYSFHADVITVALAGISEEFLYRLMLYPAMRMYFRDSGHGEEKALVLSSLLFGIAHLSNLTGGAEPAQVLFQCCYTTVLGVLFANGCRRSGCIWGSVFWHVLLNITGFLFA